MQSVMLGLLHSRIFLNLLQVLGHNYKIPLVMHCFQKHGQLLKFFVVMAVPYWQHLSSRLCLGATTSCNCAE